VDSAGQLIDVGGAPNEVTYAQLASVHRALSGLAKQGVIVRLERRFRDGRTRWCTPEFAAKHPGGEGLPRSDRALAAKIRISASTVRRARLRAGAVTALP
jgi:hypothetical protein